jgi:hypothetical protein
MKNKLEKLIVRQRNWLVFIFYNILARFSKEILPVSPEADFIVSIASYPKRDHLLPPVFQALTKQTVVPNKWILVLSVEDYPFGLPSHLQKLQSRGLEILWVNDNPYAVKKLIPVIEKYPKYAVITLDDDIIYHQFLIQGLITQSQIDPKAVIGYVGKTMLQKNGELNMYYRNPKPANMLTPSNQVYLIGWAGILYPPDSLHAKVVNMEAVHQIVPGRGSDIWFWAAAHAKNTPQICLGLPENYNLGIPIPQDDGTAPKDQPGKDVLLERFQMAIDFFGIREKLVNILSNN